MTILDKIIANKRKEIEQAKKLCSLAQLEKAEYFTRKTISLKQSLLNSNKPGIIAEFKRKSPSKGIINDRVKVEEVIQGYCQAGAAGLSVLTDEMYFGGKAEDLPKARINKVPILRKDFMVDEYQVLEAKAWGADVILIIAEALTKEEVFVLAKLAKSLQLDVLMEIHSEDQLAKVNPYLDIVGVNNRNLKTFEVSIQTSVDLYTKIPDDFVKISESGISSVENIKILDEVGFKGFLIGENFMKTDNPGKACKEFIQKLKK
ncbi:MAG: indole-3-glycerol phosphate synthase TrpC [Bacteroidales bacterium]|nr:indole-3-glycerol phosphate synthase TrpC [Bacteroidales bacterium]